ncbi:hypothetical protein FOA52_003034 [Chlamydomonas sp. UWO 241]|nr:hypothetical protein FOA52_003034 [Chlamydomonas sp. UWO 241]
MSTRRMAGLSGLAWGILLLIYCPLISQCLKADPYKTLGISRSASDEEIKREYRKLALKYHPDKNPKGQNKFVEVQESYEMLSNPVKKRQYDAGGGTQGGGSRYANSNDWHRHAQQQHQHQQQWQHNEHVEKLLPSDTKPLTLGNFRAGAFYSGKPAFMLVLWSEHSLECRAASGTWEAAWKSIGGGRDGGGFIGMGRVHWRTQRNLVYWLNKALGGWDPLAAELLPVVLGVPRGCTDFDCMRRFRGNADSLAQLTEFVADELLQLPVVPLVTLPGLQAFLAKASLFKVTALAFGKAEGNGALSLRNLAREKEGMVTFARVRAGGSGDGGSKGVDSWATGPEGAAAWSAALGVTLPPPPFAVFLRGPGTVPEVVPLAGAKAAGAELDRAITERGLIWQSLPPLRPSTAVPMGCVPTGGAASGAADLCVVVVSPRGPGQDAARANAYRLLRFIWAYHVAGAPAGASLQPLSRAAAAMDAGKLRIGWLDASTQPGFCAYHFHGRSSSSGGDDDAGSNSPRSSSSPCGVLWWSPAGLRARLTRAAPQPPARLLAFRPAGPAPTQRNKRRPPYLWAALGDKPAADFSDPHLSDGAIAAAAQWLVSALADAASEGHAPAAPAGGGAPERPPPSILKRWHGAPPPPLIVDDAPSVVDMLAAVLSGALRLFARVLSGAAGGWSSLPDGLGQALSVAGMLLVLLVLNTVWYQVAHPANTTGVPPGAAPHSPSWSAAERASQRAAAMERARAADGAAEGVGREGAAGEEGQAQPGGKASAGPARSGGGDGSRSGGGEGDPQQPQPQPPRWQGAGVGGSPGGGRAGHGATPLHEQQGSGLRQRPAAGAGGGSWLWDTS